VTIFYPDLSSYQAGYIIPSGTPAVVAKATEGAYYIDSSFEDFKAQAAKLGAVFSGYHFLKSESSPEAQAQYYYNTAGKTPCMIDCEQSGGSRPGVDWCVRFTAALHALGGRVWSVYYPSWYLSLTGGSLASLGLPVIASDYRSYSDSSWPVSYGGVTPTVWQYTSTPIDMNAFKGTPAELVALINGGSSDMNLTDTVTFSPSVDQQFPDLTAEGFGGSTTIETVWLWTAARVAEILNKVNDLEAKVTTLATSSGTANPAAVADAELAEIKAKL
jgi:lysozyme